MTSLSGQKAKDFVEWLEEAKWMLPPTMKISEAQALFERRLKKEIKDDSQARPSIGKTRAKCFSGVAELPPTTKRLLS